MKRILILIPNKRRYLTILFIAATLILLAAIIIKTVFLSDAPTFGDIEAQEISALEKENSRLKGVLESIVFETDESIYEDQYRNRYKYSHGYTPESFEIFPLEKVLKDGAEIKYNLSVNEPGYLRTLYNPDWKSAYFRGWLNLPHKNIIARHRLFVYPVGGSANFDFEGTMSFDSTMEIPIEASSPAPYQNMGLLVYGFNVKSVRYYKSQLALIGEPLRKGLQKISIDRFDLIPDEVTKEILIQLVTPHGYEIDYIYETVYIPDYLRKKTEDTAAEPAGIEADSNKTLDRLMDENLYLRKELSYFIPPKDEVITQEKCKPIPPNFPLDADLKTVRQKGRELPVNIRYRDAEYRRPVYDPSWLKNYRERWCYVPKQICHNLHRMFFIPQSQEELADLFGILGFKEYFTPTKAGEYGFLLYNFKTGKAVLYEDQLVFIGTPSRNGAEVVFLTGSNIPLDQINIIRMATPDDQELDYAIP